MGRSYRLKRRAEAVEETRRRIVEAAVELHGSIGPARTTISAVAGKAGVERLTVYRHFPDDTALFAACTGHWLAQNPPPDVAQWSGIAVPRERLTSALRAMYAYYERTASMLDLSYRDAPLVPALALAMAGMQAYLDAVAGSLEKGWPARGRRRARLRIALKHALSFGAWRSLRAAGADCGDAVDLMAGLACAAAGEEPVLT